MRKIGHIEEFSKALVFSDYLYSEGIRNDVDGDEESGGDIWVHDEDLLERSEEELKQFELAPYDAKYEVAEKMAETLRRKEEKAKQRYSKKVHDRSSITNMSLRSVAPATFALIVISVVVTLAAGLGSGSNLT
jgi:hypothetical protein